MAGENSRREQKRMRYKGAKYVFDYKPLRIHKGVAPISRILHGLEHLNGLERAVIVGRKNRLDAHIRNEGYSVEFETIEQGKNIYSNAEMGYNHLGGEGHVLFIASDSKKDVPPESMMEFIGDCDIDQFGAFIPIIGEEQFKLEKRHKFYFKLIDDRGINFKEEPSVDKYNRRKIRMTNLLFADLSKFGNPQFLNTAYKLRQAWRHIPTIRKLFGEEVDKYFLTKDLTMSQAVNALSRQFGGKLCLVDTFYPELEEDLDTEEDFSD